MTTSLAGLRILLVEDHAVVRSSLAVFLESHGATIVGEASTGAQGHALALEHRPDVILMDITLPDQDGIAVTRAIRADWPEARILALTMHSEELYLLPFLEAGGMGYVQKSAADQEVIDAILQIASGHTFVAEEGMETLVRQHLPDPAPDAPPAPDILSERELAVLTQTVRGYTNREIAQQLHISPRTVDTYRTRIMEKLHLNHRHELVDYALKYHLLS